MIIAINCAFFQPRGWGIKEYIQNIVENLSILDSENEYILYVLKDHFEYAKNTLKTNFRIKIIPFKGNGRITVISRNVFDRFFWSKEESRENWDIILHISYRYSYSSWCNILSKKGIKSKKLSHFLFNWKN